MDNIYICLFYL